VADPRHALGRQAEAVVARGLERSGWRILARRWRVPEGEIDLVCMDPSGVLVAIEVRARRSARAGGAVESVDRRHLGRLRRALAKYVETAACEPRGLRIDLVAVEHRGDRWRAVRHPGIEGW
jgi:putative endonuclease